MSFKNGFEKTAAKMTEWNKLTRSAKGVAKQVGAAAKEKLAPMGSHLKKNRKDYLMGAAAVGSLGTAIGANSKKGKK